jgi:hypothetical protein
MPTLIKAAKETIDACQKVFGDHRWNCSSISFAPNLKPDLVKGGCFWDSLDVEILCAVGVKLLRYRWSKKVQRKIPLLWEKSTRYSNHFRQARWFFYPIHSFSP